MANQKKYVDDNVLSHIKMILKNKFQTKVDKVEGMGLSHNDLTDELLEKINNAGDSSFTGLYTDLTGKPQINGHELSTGNNTLESLGIATKVSQLQNDSKFQTDTEVNSKISTATADMATNAGVQAKITEAIIDMATKTYVAQLLANINKKEIVESTTEMTDANIMYLIPNSGAEDNIYDEYIIINGKPEKVGTTKVDLTNYLQTTDLVVITNEEVNQIFTDI